MTKPMSVRSILTTGVGKSTTMVVFDGNKIHLVYASFVRTVANCFYGDGTLIMLTSRAGLRGLLRTDLRFTRGLFLWLPWLRKIFVTSSGRGAFRAVRFRMWIAFVGSRKEVFGFLDLGGAGSSKLGVWLG
jgi:hypothetical protein